MGCPVTLFPGFPYKDEGVEGERVIWEVTGKMPRDKFGIRYFVCVLLSLKICTNLVGHTT